MSTASNIIAASPYFSTFDQSKGYQFVLSRPGMAVQTREIIELQQIQQDQTSKFATAIYANGARITGGEITSKTVGYFQLQTTFAGAPVDLTAWVGQVIYPVDSFGADLGSRATVVSFVNAVASDPPTLYVVFDGVGAATDFPAGNTIKTVGTGLSAALSTNTTTYTGTAFYVGVNDGVYFIDGFFVSIPSQNIVAQKYNPTPTGVVGFTYSSQVVTPTQDPTLYDSAQGSRNTGGRGADRLQFLCSLSFYDTSTGGSPPANFTKVVQVDTGVVTYQTDNTVYSALAQEFGRRTYETNGNYTVSPFQLTTSDDIGQRLSSISSTGALSAHLALATTVLPNSLSVGDPVTISGATGLDATVYNGTFTVNTIVDSQNFIYSMASSPSGPAVGDSLVVSRPDWYTSTLSPGLAFVGGFENKTIAPTRIFARRARTTETVTGFQTDALYGNFVLGTLSGYINPTSFDSVQIKNTGGSVIGTARAGALVYVSGTVGSATYALYLFDLVMTGGNMSAATTIVDPSTSGVFTVTQPSFSGTEVPTGVIQNANLNTFIFPTVRPAVATVAPGGVNATTYSTQEKFTATTSGGSNTATFNLTGTAFFNGPASGDFHSTTQAAQNYFFIDSTTGTAVAPSTLVLSSGNQVCTATFAASHSLIALISVQNTSQAPKTKSLITETVNFTYTQGTSSYTLGRPDVYKILTATDPSNNDVTPYIKLDNGQRDDYYDNANILVPTGYIAALPSSTVITLTIQRFTHTGTGFFAADSYSGIDPNSIPYYSLASTGVKYRLTDVFDFRPVRQSGGGFGETSVPFPGSAITANVNFYLPRRDRLVMDRRGKFFFVGGTPASNPLLPPEPDGVMTLYQLSLNAYTLSSTRDVNQLYVDNRRYTMHDIGVLASRIDRLEYYTALSLLEMNANSQSVVDSTGLDRFKNGFLVDSFTGHGVGDVYNPDYRCAVDPVLTQLRAPFNSQNVKLLYSTASTGVVTVGNQANGFFATLPFTQTIAAQNLNATRWESVNPYSVVVFNGKMTLNPPSDDWVDTTQRPATTVDLTGNLDAWNYMVGAINSGMAPGYGTQWNDWQTVWTGVDSHTLGTTSSLVASQTSQAGNTQTVTDTYANTTTTATTTTSSQVRSGTQTSVGLGIQTQTIGPYVVDMSIIPYMRSVVIYVASSAMRPSTDLHCFFDTDKVNSSFVPASGYAPVSEGCCRTDANGNVFGTLTIVGGKYTTGTTHTITLIDDSNDLKQNASTIATQLFEATGIQDTTQGAIVSTRVPVLNTSTVQGSQTVSSTAITTSTSNSTTSTTTVIPPPPPPPPPVFTFPPPPPPPTPDEIAYEQGRDFQGGDRGNDPLAESFNFSSLIYPHGLFITSVDLFFRAKTANAAIPVYVEIRPMVNGYPDSVNVLPMSTVVMSPANINVPTATDQIASIVATPTTFTFPVPIYLAPDTDYCLVVGANSADYEVYCSEMGEPILGTSNNLVTQPLLGSLFKSQNSTTWTAAQNEDLCMVLRRAVFQTNVIGTVVSTNDFSQAQVVYGNLINHNHEFLDFPPATNITRSMVIRDFTTNSMPTAWTPLAESTNVLFTDGPKWIEAANDLVVSEQISTTIDSVAPMLDMTRNSAILVHNLINDFDLIDSDIAVTSGGTGYTFATFSATGGGGSGWSGSGIISGGAVVGIKTITHGTGYESLPTFTQTSGDGTGAVLTYGSFETASVHGNALARYMTRAIQLEQQFTTDLVNVIIDCYLPLDTDMRVYIRVTAPEDPTPLAQRPWVPMVCTTGALPVSTQPGVFTELTWAPSSSLSYTSGGVTYPSINTFAIKVVMLSSNSSVIPLFRDFRAISAAPA